MTKKRPPLLSNYLLIVLLFSQSVVAQDMEYPNRYGALAENLFDMMDAFSSAYQRHRYGDREAIVDYGPQMPNRPRPPELVLTGRWLGQGGEMMEIRDGLFRISRSAYLYRDGHIYIEDYEHFVLEDLETGLIRYYRFFESKGRLILQDPSGGTVLFRRMTY